LKNYIIGTLLVIILVLVSFIYRSSNQPCGVGFPIQPEDRARVSSDIDVPCFLYVFFKKNNCHDCLEIIKVLNNLPPQFVVTGIVSEKELVNEKELREITGAMFPLRSSEGYKKQSPWYTPTIIGVSPQGIILFTLPGVPNEKEYLETFLNALYGKTYPAFLQLKETS